MPQLANEELKALLADEVAAMNGNLAFNWQPRNNVALFNDLLGEQIPLWLDEIAETAYDWTCGAIDLKSLQAVGDTVAPSYWFDSDGVVQPELAVLDCEHKICRAANRLAYNIAELINLQCAAIVSQIQQWWQMTSQDVSNVTV